MSRYIIQVKVYGQVFEYPVDSKAKAESEVEKIKNNGYRHHEGNAVEQFKSVTSVTYRKEDG